MKSPEYLAINPMGKVPAVRHGRYDRHRGGGDLRISRGRFPGRLALAPPSGSRLRGPYYRWLFFAAGPIEAANTNKALKLVVPAERTKMVGYGTQEEVLSALEDRLNRSEYIADDRFTAADVYVGSQVRIRHEWNGDRQATCCLNCALGLVVVRCRGRDRRQARGGNPEGRLRAITKHW